MSETEVRPMEIGPIIYVDRRIWRTRDENGNETTTVTKIGKLLGKEVREDQVVVVEPIAEQSMDDLIKRFAFITGMRLLTIVIPERAKIETLDGYTMWVDVNAEQLRQLGEKYRVPVWQLGVGRLYPPQSSVQELPPAGKNKLILR